MKKNANIKHGNWYCECFNQVFKKDNYCSQCGSELKFIECEHIESYSKHYIDYDRNCYSIYCLKCYTELADVGHFQYPDAKIKYNVIEER